MRCYAVSALRKYHKHPEHARAAEATVAHAVAREHDADVKLAALQVMGEWPTPTDQSVRVLCGVCCTPYTRPSPRCCNPIRWKQR